MGKKKLRSKVKVTIANSALASQLDEIAALMDRKRWDDARAKLEPLVVRHPNNVEALEHLVNVGYEQKDMPGYQHAIERLSRLTPYDPEVALGLAGAYLSNVRPILGLRAFRSFLRRWPTHKRAAEARKTVEELESSVRSLLDEMGLTGDEGFERAAQHEEAQVLLETGQYAQARKVEEQILRRAPHFAPALNNISLAYWAEGKLPQAISHTQRVLEFDPQNFHALSNLTRYLLLAGRADEAQQTAERLKAIESTEGDVWVKKAEALSYLGDHEAVLAVMDAAQRNGEPLATPRLEPLLYHLAAVAAWRLGREQAARQYWQQALKLSPSLAWARENLDDLRKPVGERHAPWPFALTHWLSEQAIGELIAQFKPAGVLDDNALREAAQRYVRRHPELAGLVPHLLAHGDPIGRELAIHVATLAQTPEMLAALRDFALSQNGPDAMRHSTAQTVSQAGLFFGSAPNSDRASERGRGRGDEAGDLAPAGMVRMWLQGQWQEVLLLNYQLHAEDDDQHSPQVADWLREATIALRRHDAITGERLLQQALAVEPDAPDLANNLAVAYEQQGRSREALQMVRDLHRRQPDYVFARIGMAQQCVREGKFDEADALLKPLFERKRFHVRELSEFCRAEIELELARNHVAAARSWFDLWSNADPEHPQLEATRLRMDAPGWARKLLRR